MQQELEWPFAHTEGFSVFCWLNIEPSVGAPLDNVQKERVRKEQQHY